MTFSTLLSGLSGQKSDFSSEPLAEHVDIQRYMGDWYVVANIPTIFEKNAFNAVESYTWNETDNRVDIDFDFNSGKPDGEVKHIPQKGFIDDAESNAVWKVQPIWPLKFSYLIHDLADDYSDVIVGMPDRSHVWIMSRTPQMKPARFEELKQKVGGMGYDLAKLQNVPQAKASGKVKAGSKPAKH